MKTALPGIAMRSSQDKLLLIEAIGESLSANSDNVPVAAWQINEMLRRKASFLRDNG
jgi:hypothetical protein